MFRYPFEKVQPITQEFGENPGGYARFQMKAHNGLDFGAVEGTPVLAAADGDVVKSEFDDGGYGNHVVIDHGTGYTTVYAHLSQLRVGAHIHVRAGQLIGLVGSTGNSTGAHLHFEVRMRGQEGNGFHGAVDPRPLVEWPGVTVATPAPLPEGKVRVVATGLNVRQAPSLRGAVIGMVLGGTMFTRAGEAVEADGCVWVPVVVWVAAKRGEQKLMEV